MLTIQTGTSESDALSRIKAARGNSEPEQAPTEEPEVVDVSSDTPAEEETEEAEVTNELQEETEEVETAEVEESEEWYLDLDGEEVSSTQVKEWKNGHLMQADYTRKTTELSEQRSALESKQAELDEKNQKINESLALLNSMVEDETLTSEELAELREDDPDEYIKYTEKQNKRKEVLNSVKAEKPISFNHAEEQNKLFTANPSWMDNGKPTEKFRQDSQLLNDYASAKSITPEKFATFDASMVQMMLNSARYEQLDKKNNATAKQVRKAPITTKPKQAAKIGLSGQIEEAQKKFKANPTDANAIALRKLKRQLNN